MVHRSHCSIFVPTKLVPRSPLSSEAGAHVEKNRLREDMNILPSIDPKISLCMHGPAGQVDLSVY